MKVLSGTSQDLPPMPATPAGQFTAQEQSAITRRVGLRLMPLLFFCYVIAYVDRINVGFAKLHLQAVLGVDDKIFSSVFGFGAGLFFIGYFIFEVPSNLILHRIGARIWMTRIMMTWGVICSAMMFVRGPQSFYGLRFLLGVAEAGFFPGIVLYLTYWIPSR